MRKYDLVVNGLAFDDFYCKRDIEKIIDSKPGGTVDLDILVKNPGEIDFLDEMGYMFNVEYDPRWSCSRIESLEDGSIAYRYIYDFEPTLDLDSDMVQKEALEACGYSENQIDIHLRAKHNWGQVHYEFADAAGWLAEYIDDLGVKFDESDPDEIGDIGKDEFIGNELFYDFGTSETAAIIKGIESGDIHADQLGGLWCDVFSVKVWVKEW